MKASRRQRYGDDSGCHIGAAEDFYHVEQLRHLLGNKLTLPLTVLGQLGDGKRVSQRTIKRAVRDLQTIAEQFGAQQRQPKRRRSQ